MVGVVVATHGELGAALVRTAEMILGPLDQVAAVGFLGRESEEQMQALLEDACQRVNTGDGVLLMVDMIGGTPSNLGFRRMKAGQFEVITGVNLPMLLKAGGRSQQGLAELAQEVKDAGIRTILLASDLLRER